MCTELRRRLGLAEGADDAGDVGGQVGGSDVLVSAIGFGGFVYGLSGLGEMVLHPPPVSPWIPLGVGMIVVVAVGILSPDPTEPQPEV